MTQKDRLIELLHDWGTKNTDGINADSVAKHLLENNVMVLPCKIGSVLELRIYEKVSRYRFQGIRQQFANSKPELFGVQLFGERLGVSIANVDSIGKTVFIVEEIEQALKGGTE